MGMFDGMNDGTIPTGGQRIYFSGGSYRVQVDVIKSIPAEEAFDGIPSYIAEVIVLQSDNPTLRTGAVVGWVEKLKKKTLRKSFANIKGFLAACMGVANEADFAAMAANLGYHLGANGRQQMQDGMPVIHYDRMASDMASEANPLRGMVVDLVCTEKPKRDGDGVFTVHHWHPKGYLDEKFGVHGQ